MFLMGVNYAKFSLNHSLESSLEMVQIIQERINTNKFTFEELNMTYDHLLNQNSLSSVFSLEWLKKFKFRFERI